jgi:hypothetical protein
MIGDRLSPERVEVAGERVGGDSVEGHLAGKFFELVRGSGFRRPPRCLEARRVDPARVRWLLLPKQFIQRRARIGA